MLPEQLRALLFKPPNQSKCLDRKFLQKSTKTTKKNFSSEEFHAAFCADLVFADHDGRRTGHACLFSERNLKSSRGGSNFESHGKARRLRLAAGQRPKRYYSICYSICAIDTLGRGGIFSTLWSAGGP